MTEISGIDIRCGRRKDYVVYQVEEVRRNLEVDPFVNLDVAPDGRIYFPIGRSN